MIVTSIIIHGRPCLQRQPVQNVWAIVNASKIIAVRDSLHHIKVYATDCIPYMRQRVLCDAIK